MKSGYPIDFSMVSGPNRVLTPLKSISKIRISSFVSTSYQNLRFGMGTFGNYVTKEQSIHREQTHCCHLKAGVPTHLMRVFL